MEKIEAKIHQNSSKEQCEAIKVIAFYLPQFYEFPENDRWWGKGFTEWTNVKKSQPLYEGHYQPTVPLNQNYYTLEDVEVMKWQANLARTYGLYGFCFYHYWFGNDRKLMEKPVENYLSSQDIEFPYCICWANHNWSRTWVGGDRDILMSVVYGDEMEWERHFQYLLPYFKDKRYITINGKPAFIVYQPEIIPCNKEMFSYFQKRAKEEGFLGLTIIAQRMFKKYGKELESFIDYKIQYEPDFSRTAACRNIIFTIKNCPSFLMDLILYRIKGVVKFLSRGKLCKYRTYSYDAIWNYIIKSINVSTKMIAGAFVKCDVTPRRQERALIYKGASPEKFEKYMKKLVQKVKEQYDLQMIFLSAWNEWGEGMYLEPDEKYGYKYLESVKNAIN